MAMKTRHYNITEYINTSANTTSINSTLINTSLGINHLTKYPELITSPFSSRDRERSEWYAHYYSSKGQYRWIPNKEFENFILSSNELAYSSKLLQQYLGQPQNFNVFSLDAVWMTIDFTLDDLHQIEVNKDSLRHLTGARIKSVPSGQLRYLYEECDNWDFPSGAKVKFYNCCTHSGIREGRLIIPMAEMAINELTSLFYGLEYILERENYVNAFKNAYFTRVEPGLVFYGVPYAHLLTIDNIHRTGVTYPLNFDCIGMASSVYDGVLESSSHTISYDVLLNLIFKKVITPEDATKMLLACKLERVHLPHYNNGELRSVSNLPNMPCHLTRSKVLDPLALLELKIDILNMLVRYKVRNTIERLSGQDLRHLKCFLDKKEHYLPVNKEQICRLQKNSLVKLKQLILDPVSFI